MDVLIEPKVLYADNQSLVTITAVPLNSFGKRAWFRTISAEFELKEGKELVEIVEQDEKSGKLILKAKSETGNVIVEVKSKFSLLPVIVEIHIYPNYT